MTDEELGRAWATAARLAPQPGGPGWVWWTHDDPDAGTAGLPAALWGAAGGHTSEADAYAAVGGCLREVLRVADQTRAALSGFDAGSPGDRQDFKEWIAAAIEDGLPAFRGLDEDERGEAIGRLADTIVDQTYSHFRFEGEP